VTDEDDEIDEDADTKLSRRSRRRDELLAEAERLGIDVPERFCDEEHDHTSRNGSGPTGEDGYGDDEDPRALDS
jgi:hypothetical protein